MLKKKFSEIASLKNCHKGRGFFKIKFKENGKILLYIDESFIKLLSYNFIIFI